MTLIEEMILNNQFAILHSVGVMFADKYGVKIPSEEDQDKTVQLIARRLDYTNKLLSGKIND